MLVTMYADPRNFSTPIVKDLSQSVIIAAWHDVCVNVPYYSASALMMGICIVYSFCCYKQYFEWSCAGLSSICDDVRVDPLK